MSHCGTMIRYENATVWHFGRPPDTNFMPHCDMQIRYEMSQCHTFQLRKNVFSYEMCDIVTSQPPITPNFPPIHGPLPIGPAEARGCIMGAIKPALEEAR